jgi:hypothetical protein
MILLEENSTQKGFNELFVVEIKDVMRRTMHHDVGDLFAGVLSIHHLQPPPAKSSLCARKRVVLV